MFKGVSVHRDIPLLGQSPQGADMIEVAMGKNDGGRPSPGPDPLMGRPSDPGCRSRQPGIDQDPAAVGSAGPAEQTDVDEPNRQIGEVRGHRGQAGHRFGWQGWSESFP